MKKILDDREYLSPPDNEAESVFRCLLCKDWIYEGDEYYLISGFEYCKDCAEKRIAESYDMERDIADIECHDM